MFAVLVLPDEAEITPPLIVKVPVPIELAPVIMMVPAFSVNPPV
jgi:hypothetical protein